MTTARITAIRELANYLFEKTDKQFPVDVEKLVTSWNGAVKKLEPNRNAEALIYKSENGEPHHFTIEIDEKLTEQRRRFSIAHELGHLFIHMFYMIDEEKWNMQSKYEDSILYRSGFSVEEIEANDFAANLLMPADKFREFFEKNPIGNVAENFGVSVNTVYRRAVNLGIIE